MGDDIHHECPDDAAVHLSFNAPVDPAFVRDRLLHSPRCGDTPVPLTVHRNSRCGSVPCLSLNVSLGPLTVATVYNITLLAGTKVST